MYRVSVEQDFDAAHFLRGYRGKCESLHGHRFRVVLKAEATGIDELGMAYDFTELKKHLGMVLARYDHTCLNDIIPFDTINPSSENIARTIHDEVSSCIVDTPIVISCIEVWESPGSGAGYYPD